MAQAINGPDEPGNTMVEIRGIVRAERRPWYHVPGNCCPKTEDLCCCGRHRCGVYKILSTDTGCNNKDKKRRDPNTILVPAERQENAEREMILDVSDDAHQLRILSPPKETYSSKQSGTIEIQGATFTDNEGNHRDDHNPNANKLCEIYGHVARNTVRTSS